MPGSERPFTSPADVPNHLAAEVLGLRMPTKPRGLPRGVAFDAVVFASGALVAVLAIAVWLHQGPVLEPDHVLAPLLIIAMAQSPLVVPTRAGDAVIGFESCVLVFLALVTTPAEALAMWALGTGLAHTIAPKSLRTRLFNVGLLNLSGLLMVIVIHNGSQVAGGFGGVLAAVLAGCAVYFLFDLMITSLSLAVDAGEPLARALNPQGMFLPLACFLGIDTIGFLAAVLRQKTASPTLLLLLVPVVTILVATRAVTRARGHEQRMSGLFSAATLAPTWGDEGEVEQALVGQAEQVLRNTVCTLGADPPAAGEIGSPLTVEGRPARWLVARRIANGLHFDDDDQRALDLLTAVAAESLARRRLVDEMAHRARHDALTGLANRTLFTDRLTHAVELARRSGRQLAVVYCDLDGFKSVNDRFGHGSGDLLLVAVGERIRGCMRTADTAARLGGDEFALLLEDVAPGGAEHLAGRVIAALQSPFVVDGVELRIGASVGIAYLTGTGDAADLLRDADIAMYRAKALGKNRWDVFEPQMRARSLHRIELETELRRAVDSGSIGVHYQPVVDLPTGLVTGVEALARWTHPELGTVAPGVFIPLAEEIGLVREVGRQILLRAHREVLESLPPGSEPFALGINISARQVGDRSLLATLAELVAHDPVVRIVLELTETALLDDDEASERFLHEVRDLGIRLAVDDFGVGYSSVAYLQRFPVDTVKIDRSFTAGLQPGSRSLALVQAVTAMASALDLVVVAEGIEDWPSAAILREVGCDRGQGFLFGAPAPADSLPRLMAERQFDLSPMHGVRAMSAAGIVLH